ncbi:hypothetical protein MTO96_008616 [Rhipicephalus appendiculatus]
MFPGLAPPRPWFRRSKCAPVRFPSGIMPGHGGTVHRNSALTTKARCFEQCVGMTPALPSLSTAPRDHYRMQRDTTASASTLVTASTTESVVSDSSSHSSTRSGPPTPSVAMVQLPMAEYISQRSSYHRDPGPAAQSQCQAASWHSYSAIAGTFIVLGCFALLAVCFVDETLFAARHTPGDDHQGSAKADDPEALLAGSRNLVKYDVVPNRSSIGRQVKTPQERRLCSGEEQFQTVITANCEQTV